MAMQVVEQITAAGGEATANGDDVGDFQAAGGDRSARPSSAYGQLDVLINVAGILRDRMVFNMSEEEWDAVLRVHLKGTFNTTHHATSLLAQAAQPGRSLPADQLHVRLRACTARRASPTTRPPSSASSA